MKSKTQSKKEYTVPRQWRNDPRVVHVGRRSFGRILEYSGQKVFRKCFHRSIAGWTSYFAEKRAMQALHDFPWATPWVRSGWTFSGHPWFEVSAYSEEDRLDRVLARADEAHRQALASEALSIVLDLYVAGYAHRDFHVRNLALVNGRLQLSDFEFLVPYPPSARPPFRECYDLTGEGLPTPGLTRNMGFNALGKPAKNESVITHASGISLPRAMEGLSAILKGELLEASKTFQTVKSTGRHTCKAQKIYCSFQVPGLVIREDEAQRNSSKRFQRYSLDEDSVRGKSVLDLGCHAGGMLFAAQRFNPGRCLGIEFDKEKVRVARRIAAFAELSNIRFAQADVDRLRPAALEGPFDVVFCFALEGHLKKRERLYRVLGELTRDVLLFETNAKANPEDAVRLLKANGFTRVESLGVCDDDVLPENNVRHLIKAWK